MKKENENKTECQNIDINKLENLSNLTISVYEILNKNSSNSSIPSIYGFIQNILKNTIFRILDDNTNKITTWDEFKDSDTKCSYNKFRKLVVDYLIINIIICLFKDRNYTISKGSIQFFDSNKRIIEGKIKITYEMVGSEDVTSDYDVSIYSIPLDPLIPTINSIFSSAFTNGLGKPSSEIFDTNLYCHPFYIFTQNTNTYENSSNNNNDLFLKLLQNKYFLNSGHKVFHQNELLFSNLNYFDSNSHYNFQKFIIDQSVFKENIGIKQTIETCNSTNCGICNIDSCNATITTPIEKEKHDFCIDSQFNTKINNTNCKEKLTQFTEIRGDVDSISTSYLSELYDSGLSNEINKDIIKVQYISPMRLSLWYADETYSTFSAYFHVIHCLAVPHQNIATINTLLSIMKESFINICRVSALDNFAFIFHYYNYETNIFIKKVAKYIARISHACALIKLLQESQTYILTETNMKEFKNFGNHTYITNKYKNKMLDPGNKSLREGLLSLKFDSLLSNKIKLKINMEIIKSIYFMLTKEGYGIEERYLCVVPK